jgi:hypothetical protein
MRKIRGRKGTKHALYEGDVRDIFWVRKLCNKCAEYVR